MARKYTRRQPLELKGKRSTKTPAQVKKEVSPETIRIQELERQIVQFRQAMSAVVQKHDVLAEKLRLSEARVAHYQRKNTAQARAWAINARKLNIASGMALMTFEPEPVNFMEEPPSMIPHESMSRRVQAAMGEKPATDGLVGRELAMKLETKSRDSDT